MKKVSTINDLLYGVILYLTYTFLFSACGHKESRHASLTEDEIALLRVLTPEDYKIFHDSLESGAFGKEYPTDGPEWSHTYFLTEKKYMVVLDDHTNIMTIGLSCSTAQIDSTGCLIFLSGQNMENRKLPKDPYFSTYDIAEVRNIDEGTRRIVENFTKQTIPNVLKEVRRQ